MECEYSLLCPDMQALRESYRNAEVNENLADQLHELCMTSGRVNCILYRTFNKNTKKEAIRK